MYDPIWEKKDFVYLDKKWRELEWIYVNTDAVHAPQIVSMTCSFAEFLCCIHDALEGDQCFWDLFASTAQQTLADDGTFEFDDLCEYLGSAKADFTFQQIKADQGNIWAVMTVFSEVCRILRGVSE